MDALSCLVWASSVHYVRLLSWGVLADAWQATRFSETCELCAWIVKSQTAKVFRGAGIIVTKGSVRCLLGALYLANLFE